MKPLRCLTASLALLLCGSVQAVPATDPCASKKGAELMACLKANPPKTVPANAAAAKPNDQADKAKEQAAQAKAQQAANQKSPADKAKASQLHDLTKGVK